MNNEEKILSLLETIVNGQAVMQADITGLQAEITGLKNGQAKLETGQAELSIMVDSIEAKVMRLEAGQVALTTMVNKQDARQDALLDSVNDLRAGQIDIHHDVKAICEQTQDLVEFEAEVRLNMKSIKGVTRVNTLDIAELKAAINI